MNTEPGNTPDGDADQPAADPASSGPDAAGPDAAGPDAAGADGGERSSFDAAFEGEGWSTSRRRRSSSSGSSSSGSSSRSSSGRSRRSSSRSTPPEPAPSAAGGVPPGPEPAAAAPAPGSTPPPPPPPRRSSRSSGSRRGGHIRSVVVHVVLGLLGVGLVWIVVTGLLAAHQLDQARSDLTTLRSQVTNSADVVPAANAFSHHAHHAAALTRGPAWALLAAIPYVGDPADSVRVIAQQSADLADDAVPGVVSAAQDVNPRTVFQSGAVDLDAVSKAADPVHRASAAVTTADSRVAALPRSTWLPFVDSARDSVGDQLDSLGHTLRTTDQTLQVLPTMLGADGRTRRYFVAFQNNAELRGTGGLPGAFAIVAAVDGKVSIERFESDRLLAGVVPSGQEFGAAFDTHYKGDLAYTQYQNSNLSPHFPYAAQIWIGMWKHTTGVQLDGALTVDPGALSYLLAATGPATAPDGEKVTSDNVVSLLEKDAYAKFPTAGESEDRTQYILGIAEAVENRILAGKGNGRTLLQGLARGVGERRILAWSSDQQAEAVLAGAPIGGVVATTSQPYSFLWVNNGGGGKLDYYLHRSVAVQRTGCGDTRDVTVTITLTNTAPSSGLPPYVTGRPDNPVPPVPVGQVRSVIDYAATDGAQLLGTTVDGQTSGASIFDEQGHPTYQNILEIAPGQTRTWVLQLQEPAGTAPYTVVTQPGVTPAVATVDDRSCRS